MKINYNTGYKTITSDNGMILYNKEDNVTAYEIIAPEANDLSSWEEIDDVSMEKDDIFM